ncbi:hypothetical protein B0H21DRAFT_819799 [Amylocystis lapponica]|nr:hypothetical protein B0H21DRAFT_819799 [Amylocystis lapponica]
MPSFVRSEVTAALSEQAFGIASAELTSSTDLVASARVVLLEGTIITISLSVRGYQLGESGEGSADTDTLFESIEVLLASVSPLYVDARRNALLVKLHALT